MWLNISVKCLILCKVVPWAQKCVGGAKKKSILPLFRIFCLVICFNVGSSDKLSKVKMPDDVECSGHFFKYTSANILYLRLTLSVFEKIFLFFWFDAY